MLRFLTTRRQLLLSLLVHLPKSADWTLFSFPSPRFPSLALGNRLIGFTHILSAKTGRHFVAECPIAFSCTRKEAFLCRLFVNKVILIFCVLTFLALWRARSCKDLPLPISLQRRAFFFPIGRIYVE